MSLDYELLIIIKLCYSRTEIDEAVRKSVNLLLTKSMSGQYLITSSI